MSLLVRKFLGNNNTVIMPQPPYSPDLTICNFFLFPKLKRSMIGRRFATIEEIKTASLEELKTIPKSAYQNALRIGKSAGTSVLYLRGITLKGTLQILMNSVNKYFSRKIKNSSYILNSLHIILVFQLQL